MTKSIKDNTTDYENKINKYSISELMKEEVQNIDNKEKLLIVRKTFDSKYKYLYSLF